MKDDGHTPFLDEFIRYTSSGYTSFDVPGHHLGNINNKLTGYIGKKIFQCDINTTYGIDNLAHPTGVIKESERLMASFCHADNSFFLINGTSSGLLAAILTVCQPNDRIIIPRNVHKSISNAMILAGTIPTYVNPFLDEELEIANQPTAEDYKKIIKRYPSAKAVIIINPTYFGSILNLKEVIDYAHKKNMIVIVDEAHGAHYYFSNKGPINAMDAGADISVVSFHKTAGSLTQTSVLLQKGKAIDPINIQETLNISNTTSPNHILLASLDAARSYLVDHGEEEYQKIIKLSNYAYQKINRIPGFEVKGWNYFKKNQSYDYDSTKLLITFDNLDINGFDIFRILYDEYKIQMELAETYVILGIIALGTTKKHIDTLVHALQEISKKHFQKNIKYPLHSFSFSYGYMIVRPRDAYYAPGKIVKLNDALGHISKESIVMYPPGIAMVQPGEIITKEIIEQIRDGLRKKCTLISNYPNANKVRIIDEQLWKKFSHYQDKLLNYAKYEMTVPRRDLYSMPFEGDYHDGTLVLLPFRQDVWKNKGEDAMPEFKELIKAISQFEPVYVGINPSIYNKNVDWVKKMNNVLPIKIKYNDCWSRDNALIFVSSKKKHDSRAVDFRFNAWGGNVDGLYDDYQDDDSLGQNLTKIFNLETYYLPNFVLEGGSIATDGEGTIIVTEACLLSKGRNPLFNRQEIEEKLKIYLGISEIIWIPHGIIGDDTNEHVDNMVAFSKPGEVLLAWPNSSQNREQMSASSKALHILENATDAKGRKLKVIKVRMPEPISLTIKDTSQIKDNGHSAKVYKAGEILPASYINFYQGKHFVILPSFGVKEDEIALSQFKTIFPHKKVIQIKSREILYGGGNIHCVTCQIAKGAIRRDK